MKNTFWRKGCAGVALAALMQPVWAVAEDAGKIVEVAPKSSEAVRAKTLDIENEPILSHAQKLALLQKKVKYVFVLFQENRSFDSYFSTFPGVDGLYSKGAGATPGFVQPIVNTDGTVTTISPFKIPATVTDVNGNVVPLYPADIASVNHAHLAIDAKLNIDGNNVAHNDRYAVTEEGLTLVNGVPNKLPSLAKKQMGELVMAHIDCDTIPFLWNYADRFTLFDNFFDTVIGPSTPNAIAMIAGQSGETQWVKHPEESTSNLSGGVPVVGDPDPFWGSSLDVFSNPQQPEPGRTSNPATNLTFASLPLTFMGSKVYDTTQADLNPAGDLSDVEEDMNKIANHANKAVNWGWYQEGYDHEPTDPTGTVTNATYIAHHNGPQYFGYVSNNPIVTKHLHGLGDFYSDVAKRKLPAAGGVFYVRGGYGNLDNLVPQDPNPVVRADFAGNDDHPGYSDSQISEALLADEINAITNSPYWKDSAIVITYDETDGFYDHARPKVRSRDPQGNPLDQGPRIPMILLSPYARVHVIDHERTEHSSIIKFVDELYNLVPLAQLPDEEKARKQGEVLFHQNHLGPADWDVDGVGDLFSAFDNNRLLGKVPPLEPEYAQIPQQYVTSLPHFGGKGCQVLNIAPTDLGKPNPVPADFNPRPGTNPGIPTSGTWIP